MADMRNIRDSFFETPSKIEQEIRLFHMISVTAIERKRPVKRHPEIVDSTSLIF